MAEKVLVLRASNTRNYGSLMMVANFISHYAACSEGAIFFVDNDEVDGIDRIRSESLVGEVYSMRSLGITPKPSCDGQSTIVKLWKYSLFSILYGKMLRRAGVDKVVYLGGDDFSEYYSRKSLVIELVKLLSLRACRRKVIMAGQTMGPFTGWRVFLAKIALRGTKIFTRDNACFVYLTTVLGLNDVVESADLAFLDLPLQGSHSVVNDVTSSFNLPDEYIVVVPSGLWKSYSTSYDCYIDSWVNFIICALKEVNHVVVMAHVLSKTSSDNVVIDSIKQKLGNLNGVQYIQDTLLPSTAREVISRAVGVVSGRMHACVSALQAGRWAVAVSYSVKFDGVIGELGFKDMIVDGSADSAWLSGEMSEQMIMRVRMLMRRYSYSKKSNEIISSVTNLRPKILIQIEQSCR